MAFFLISALVEVGAYIFQKYAITSVNKVLQWNKEH
jgi:hypothetical protein